MTRREEECCRYFKQKTVKIPTLPTACKNKKNCNWEVSKGGGDFVHLVLDDKIYNVNFYDFL